MSLLGAGVGFSAYSILVQAWWQEELQRFRSPLRERERANQYATTLGAKFADSPGAPLTEAEKAGIANHNTKIDRPAPPTAH